MTSSLVGSEMCIRDSRLDTKHRSMRLFKRRNHQIIAQNAHRLEFAGDRACLLYTSDAADDM
eukprot:4787555-Prorocentrum_lima.AAC.1